MKSYFGHCDNCNSCGIMHVGRHHYGLCNKNKTFWYIGSNLLSGWREQTEEQKNENIEYLSNLKEVEFKPTTDDNEVDELELHRADHQAMKEEGFESVGELLSAYKRLKLERKYYKACERLQNGCVDKLTGIKFNKEDLLQDITNFLKYDSDKILSSKNDIF